MKSWLEDYIQPAIEQNKVEDFTKTLEKTRLQVEKKAKKKTTKKPDNVQKDDPDETETEDSESDHDNDVKKSKESGLASKAQTGKKKVARKAKSTKPKTKSKSSSDDLIAAIRNKKGRGNPLASIAARYGVSAMEEDPLNDAEFAKLQSKYAKK